ncbi:MAG: NADH-quinone oxidoreductase subunit NuoN [Janthinobacterium lividum]
MQTANLSMLLPDMLLELGIVVVIVLATFGVRRIAYPVAVIASVLAAIGFATMALDGHSYYYFSNSYVVDPMASLLKACVSLGFAVTLVYSHRYLQDRELASDEFFLLAMFSLLGQFLMISGNNFLSLYLGLELMSLPLYAIIALRRDSSQSTEAAMKYYVLGALSSGFLLYGISMMYGATGSLDLGEVLRAIASGRINTGVLLFGVIFIVAGVAFKLGAVPFHMWVPDVYQGAPTPMTLLIGGGSKVAAFAFMLRFLVEGFLPLAIDWQQMLVILSALSLIVGNLTGIVQRNIKRMLAYSTISHMGFILLGVLSGVVDGKADGAAGAYGSAMFYSIIYLLTTLGTFGMLMLLCRRNFEAENIDDLKGLFKRSPWTAFVMLILMFSLTGIPPTVGFYAKLAVLEAVMQAGYIWLAVLAVITSVFGAFYYLRIVKVMYFDQPEDQAPLATDGGARALLTINGLAVLALGLLPGPLMTLCLQAMRVTLAS